MRLRLQALLEGDLDGHFPITIDAIDLLDKHDSLASAILANPVRYVFYNKEEGDKAVLFLLLF